MNEVNSEMLVYWCPKCNVELVAETYAELCGNCTGPIYEWPTDGLQPSQATKPYQIGQWRRSETKHERYEPEVQCLCEECNHDCACACKNCNCC